MSIQLIFPFDPSTDYTYDENYVSISGGVASLVLKDKTAEFSQGFSSPTGFTYDSAKSEFSGDYLRQKDQRPATATCGATYTSDLNLNWGNGVLTGTNVGGATVSGGKLDLTGAIKYVEYEAVGNASSVQTGCVRFKYTPNYSGAPATNMIFFSITKQNLSLYNLIQVYQSTSRAIMVSIYNKSGLLITASNLGSWSQISGQEYEIEFNWDLTSGASHLFIDGTQHGSTLAFTGERDSAINILRIGADYNGANRVNGYFNDFEVFSNVQHTANYTAGFSVPETIYSETNATFPEMHYTGAGTLQMLASIATTDVGSPRYTLQVGRSGSYLYWSGSAWTASDGSYAQANSKADFNLHCQDMAILGEVYGQFRVHFPAGSSQGNISAFVATVTGQEYSTGNPTIEPNSITRTDGIDGFIETSTKSGSDEIKYILSKDSVWYWFNGSAWVISDQTYSQSNTAVEVYANRHTFMSVGANVKVRLFLHSATGVTTPSINELEMDYSFSGDAPDSIVSCIIWGYLVSLDGTPLQSRLVSATLEKDAIKYKTNLLTYQKTYTSTTNSIGYWELTLPETANANNDRYIFDIDGKTYYAPIPAESNKKFNSLTGLIRTK